jgi:hypothetical protein
MELIIVIVVIIFIWYMFFSAPDNLEGFGKDVLGSPVWELDWKGKDTLDCYSQSARNCLSYSNCGLADGRCIPGDKDGPFFEEYVNRWVYRDYIDEHMFGKSVLRKVDPWSARYCGYEEVWPSPVVRTAL